jgi:23S rRNA (uridine2552-2'-O)-methyltransferase
VPAAVAAAAKPNAERRGGRGTRESDRMKRKAGGGPGKTRASGGRSGPGGGQRQLSVRLKTARSRTASSQRWLERQLNDPYVAAAKREGYRSRAAYKLKEIDDKHRLLRPGLRVADLGAAPGGWSQIAAERVGSIAAERVKSIAAERVKSIAAERVKSIAAERVKSIAAERVNADVGRGQVVAIDILGMEPLAGVEFTSLDFMDSRAEERLKAMLRGGAADIVLSDMAAPTVGHTATDHLRIMALAEAAALFACDVLAPGGAFLCKVFQGGTERELLDLLKRSFATVRHVKPPASRADSAELYVLATGFKKAR